MPRPDYYAALGIEKNASAAEIKSAYRKLAKRYHPDLHPDDKQAAERFASVSEAYDILSDDKKRAAYDRGEQPGAGFGGGETGDAPFSRRYYRDFSNGGFGGGAHARYNESRFDDRDIEDLFGSFFTGGVAGEKAGFKAEPSDVYCAVTVSLPEAARGGKKQVTLPDGRTLNVGIPAGTEDGARLRLRGQGASSGINRPAGDAFVDIHIPPHPFYRREGKDIIVEMPLTLAEAVNGAEITVPTIHGGVKMRVPPGGAGKRMRLKGKGIKGGDQYVRLTVAMPDNPDDELKKALTDWLEKHPYHPRKAAEAYL